MKDKKMLMKQLNISRKLKKKEKPRKDKKMLTKLLRISKKLKKKKKLKKNLKANPKKKY
jgi:hypothetical protein